MTRTHVTTFMHAPLPPGESAQLTTRLYDLPGQQYRVTGARAVGEIPRSWIARFARLVARWIPGLGRWIANRDWRARHRAIAKLRIYHVAVGNHARGPDELDQLPVTRSGEEIAVVLVNEGEGAIVASVLVEGVIS